MSNDIANRIRERQVFEKFKALLESVSFFNVQDRGASDFGQRTLIVGAYAGYEMTHEAYLKAMSTISKATFNGWKVASVQRKDSTPPAADVWAEEHDFALIYSPEVITPNPNRLALDEAYMQMAEIWAKRSKSNRTQVGSLIVKDTRIISDGYNGLPSGEEPDVCETFNYDTNELVTKPEVLHAESNAILKLAKYGGGTAQGATMYVTLSPCKDCAKLIHQAGISRVVYRDNYRDTAGVEHLRQRGVIVEKLEMEKED